ncbi:MAG: ABC transporter substrate-binding protein [Bacteroidetes bacterium]|nr:ABC transporter substrate-binding protein [Bacteroidota bacterium]
MIRLVDQMGTTIELKEAPTRIISLVPSQTELLYDLGAGEKVLGITKFCIHPDEWFRNKTRVGGTKQLNFDKIKVLQPDLIIGNKEENEQIQIEELMRHYPVWMSDIKNLDDAINMITEAGSIINKKENAQKLTGTIIKEFEKLKGLNIKRKKIRTAYLIWNKPIMCAGPGTFIDEMLRLCGFQNIFRNKGNSRYPEITADELKKNDPELILLSSEPFPFKEKHMAEFQKACPNAIIKLVDGELFSWYGSRLQYAPSYFIRLIGSLTV